jgi:hypothetical protein
MLQPAVITGLMNVIDRLCGHGKKSGHLTEIVVLFLKQGLLLPIPFLQREFLLFMLDTRSSFAYYPMH